MKQYQATPKRCGCQGDRRFIVPDWRWPMQWQIKGTKHVKSLPVWDKWFLGVFGCGVAVGMVWIAALAIPSMRESPAYGPLLTFHVLVLTAAYLSNLALGLIGAYAVVRNKFTARTLEAVWRRGVISDRTPSMSDGPIRTPCGAVRAGSASQSARCRARNGGSSNRQRATAGK